MTYIEFFKLQAKNLFRDYKTKTPYIDDILGKVYKYDPKHFDIASIFFDYEWEDEENFTLMKAQHLIADMLGFEKWADLLKASEAELELAKLRFENQNKISLFDWEDHIDQLEYEGCYLDADSRLTLFKHSLLHSKGPKMFYDYRLKKSFPM